MGTSKIQPNPIPCLDVHNGWAKAPQCFVINALPLLLWVFITWSVTLG
jgi:hypothetical protein